MRDQETSNREAELPAIPRIGSGDWLGISEQPKTKTMNIETLIQANKLADEIQKQLDIKSEIEDEAFMKKNGHSIPPEAMDAGKEAMIAVIEKSISTYRDELKAL